MVDKAVDILLVEDDPHDVELTLRSLGKHLTADSVDVARDGAEALARLLGPVDGSSLPHALPRIVVLDLKLPKLNGLEVLRACGLIIGPKRFRSLS